MSRTTVRWWSRRPTTDALAHDLLAADATRTGNRALARLAAYRRDDWATEHGAFLNVDTMTANPTELLLPLLVDAAAVAKAGERLGVPGMAVVYQALLAVAGAAARRWFRWTRTKSGAEWTGP